MHLYSIYTLNVLVGFHGDHSIFALATLRYGLSEKCLSDRIIYMCILAKGANTFGNGLITDEVRLLNHKRILFDEHRCGVDAMCSTRA